MRRITPAVAATLAALTLTGAANGISIPTDEQVEQQFTRAQECRKVLGAPAYPSRRGWETAKRGPYFIWMHDHWKQRADRCEQTVDRVKHTRLMVAMRVVFPEWSWHRWTIILDCETGHTFSNSVIGAADETSGFQIHPPSHPWYDAALGHRDAYYGAVSARRVLHSQGWGAWTCARINGLA